MFYRLVSSQLFAEFYRRGLPLERDDSMYKGKVSINRVQIADPIIKTRSSKGRGQRDGPHASVVKSEVTPNEQRFARRFVSFTFHADLVSASSLPVLVLRRPITSLTMVVLPYLGSVEPVCPLGPTALEARRLRIENVGCVDVRLRLIPVTLRMSSWIG